MSRNRKPTKSLEKSLFSRDFVISPVSRHFLDSKVSRNRKKHQIPWKNHYYFKNSKNLVVSPVSRHFPYSKVSGNSETTKSLEYGNNDFCDRQTDRQLLLYINPHCHHHHQCNHNPDQIHHLRHTFVEAQIDGDDNCDDDS